MSSDSSCKNEQTSDRHCAGFTLMDHYQKEWQQLHSNSVNNFTRIRMISQRIDSLEKSADRRLQSLVDLDNCCKSLRSMDNQVMSIQNDLIQLEKTIPLIETILTDMRNQYESKSCNRLKSDLEMELEEKLRELSEDSMLRKEKLKSDHKKKLELLEQKQLQDLEERRHILERTFEEEKKRYLESNQHSFE